ncbi:LuxR C-terminal-related transcriptional regulator [Streptomyces sp. NPDC049813]|uniref:LuxR C-terminal-related transcriptional regulator n=1 Tax=Streptomyces sp. NPDC049813 TaxID=3365597 RepID=UPI00379E2DB6
MRPQVGLTEIRRQLGLSDSALRTALDRLSELALVRPSVDASRVFHAVDPELGIQALITKQQEQLAAEQQRMEELRVAAVAFADLTSGRPRQSAHDVEQLDGAEQIQDHIRALMRRATSEVMTFVPGGAQCAADIEAVEPQYAQLLERGVRVRALYLASAVNDPPTAAHAMRLADRGAEVRTTPTLPVKLTIIDREVVILPTEGTGEDAGAGPTEGAATGETGRQRPQALLMTAREVRDAVCALFDNYWATAALWGANPRDKDGSDLTAQEAEVLRILSRGMTDEAVAKRLGISPRTARRIAADLMEKLGARSRFQAGASAVATGWLTGEE